MMSKSSKACNEKKAVKPAMKTATCRFCKATGRIMKATGCKTARKR